MVGTLSLYSAFNTKTGEVLGKTAGRQASRVDEFLQSHPTVHAHLTPNYASRLNQVELWFGKIERDVIACGVFTSVSELKSKLMRDIPRYDKTPRTVNGRYADPCTISTESVARGH